MRPKSPETLFQRFVERGDAFALGEVFDQTAPELLTLASHLSRDAQGAEDLVQATFVAAIEAAGRWDPERPLIPWLIGILSRQAKFAWRKNSRSPDPDRVNHPETRDPAEVSEAEEFRTAVTGVLENLPPKYREVLASHLVHEKKPGEIASELGRAPGTVRVQIHRGLELLRKALPASFALGAAGAAFPTRGLAAIRTEVLGVAATAPNVVPAASAAVSTAASIGGTTIGARSVALVGLALAGAVGSFTLLQADLDPTPLETFDLTVAAVELPEQEQPAPAVPAPQEQAVPLARTILVDPPAPVAVTTPSSRPPIPVHPHIVRGRVRTDLPLSETPVSISISLPEQAAVVTTQADISGEFEADISKVWIFPDKRGIVEIQAEHPDLLPYRVPHKIDCHLDSRIPAWLGEVELRMEPPPYRIEGNITEAPGDIRALLFQKEEQVDEYEGPGPQLSLRVARSGRYDLMILASERIPHLQTVRIHARGVHELGTIAMDPGATVAGTVYGVDGPVPAGTVVHGTPTKLSRNLKQFRRLLELPEASQWLACSGETDANGNFRISGLVDTVWLMHVESQFPEAGGSQRSTVSTRVPKENLTLNTPEVRVQIVVAANGKRVPDARVEQQGGRLVRTDKRGLAEWRLAPNWRATFEVYAPGYAPQVLTVDTPEAGQTEEVWVQLEAAPASDWSLHLSSTNRPPRALFVRWRKADSNDPWAGQRAERQGPLFAVRGLPAGPVEFVVSPADERDFTLEERFTLDVQGDTTHSIEWREGGRLVLELPATSQAPTWTSIGPPRDDTVGWSPPSTDSSLPVLTWLAAEPGAGSGELPVPLPRTRNIPVIRQTSVPAGLELEAYPALPPGDYQFHIMDDERFFSTPVTVRQGKRTTIGVPARYRWQD